MSFCNPVIRQIQEVSLVDLVRCFYVEFRAWYAFARRGGQVNLPDSLLLQPRVDHVCGDLSFSSACVFLLRKRDTNSSCEVFNRRLSLPVAARAVLYICQLVIHLGVS